MLEVCQVVVHRYDQTLQERRADCAPSFNNTVVTRGENYALVNYFPMVVVLKWEITVTAATAFEVAFLHNVTRSDAPTTYRQLHAAITLTFESNIHSEKIDRGIHSVALMWMSAGSYSRRKFFSCLIPKFKVIHLIGKVEVLEKK